MAETEAKKRTGLGALADAGNTDDFSVIDAIGGPRGVIESMLPGVVFVALFVITSNLQLTIGVSAALARAAGDRAPVPTTVRHGIGIRPAGSRYLPDLGMEQSRSS